MLDSLAPPYRTREREAVQRAITMVRDLQDLQKELREKARKQAIFRSMTAQVKAEAYESVALDICMVLNPPPS